MHEILIPFAMVAMVLMLSGLVSGWVRMRTHLGADHLPGTRTAAR